MGVVDPDILSDQDRNRLGCRPLLPSLEWSLAFVVANRTTPMQISQAFLGWMNNLQEF